ncbi:four helix bundle protein [Daejeonella sp.]|uniref:four helix bundle protein n=1 Tax=Daejeonella sp. TaxID=2805397 RepID=UPI0030BB96C3
MHNFKELKVWQKSIDLTTQIYSALSCFPSDEKYGLVSQMKRAAVSIPSNIAEGCGRKSNKELKYFLSINLGSAFELETQLIVAHRLNLMEQTKMNDIELKISEIQKMIFSLERSFI